MGSRCIADEIRWDQGRCACAKCSPKQKDQSNMGNSRVKKPKQLSAKQFELFTNLIDIKFNKVSDDIAQLKLQAIQDLSLIAESMEVWNKRLSAVESKQNVGQVSNNILNNLKVQSFKCKAHNIVDHHINGMLCGFYVPPAKPPQSQWKTNEERCKHTLRALNNAFRFMRGIRLESGDTIIVAHVLCQNRYRLINLSITKNEIILSYNRRSGKFVAENYDNTTQAAAAMTAICMYYATR